MPASTRPFMGARPFSGGVMFRVWAPFADSVHVAGTFNSWSENATPLFKEPSGNWSADVPGIAVGAEYKFVLKTPFQTGPLWKNDPYAREMTNSAGNSVIAAPDYHWSTPGFSMPPWNELVIYEMHVGTFDFDPTSPASRGTFNSVIARLDDIRDLGINAIEIMAAGEFPADRSWGYNQSYMFAIERSYGGPNGFRQLVDEAHKRGIAVLFDVVYNHIGPNDLDMWRFDGWSENSKGGIYFYNDRRSVTPWGEQNRPDYGRPQVYDYLRDNALRWLEQRHCDGLRWDATNYIRNICGNNNDPYNDIEDGWKLMQRIHSEIRKHQPWKISIAEDLQQNEWITKSAEAGGAGFNSQWDAGFVHPIRRAVIGRDDGSRNMAEVQTAIELKYNGDALQRVIYTESHDEVANGHARVPEEIWPGKADSWFSKKRSTLGAGLVFTSPGIPMIFQGQEFLQYGWFDDSKELDWAWAGQHSGITLLYRDLIRLRRNWWNNTRGLRGAHVNVFRRNDADKVIAFHRWDNGGPGDDVVVVANFANRSYSSYNVGFPRAGHWRVRFNSDWSGYSSDFGNHFAYDTAAGGPGRDGLNHSADVGLGAYSLVILSQ